MKNFSTKYVIFPVLSIFLLLVGAWFLLGGQKVSKESSVKEEKPVPVASQFDSKKVADNAPTPEPKKEPNAENGKLKPLTEEEKASILDTSKWETYTNKDLGISFKYPKPFGPIGMWGEPCPDKTKPDECYSHIGLWFLDRALFMGTQNHFATNNPPEYGRGAYFGDFSEFIKGQKYIDKFCKLKNPIHPYNVSIYDCKVYKTSGGIRVARFKSDIPFADDEMGYVYMIRSTHSAYYGLVFSDHQLVFSLREVGWNAVDTKAVMDKVVDSLRFLQ